MLQGIIENVRSLGQLLRLQNFLAKSKERTGTVAETNPIYRRFRQPPEKKGN